MASLPCRLPMPSTLRVLRFAPALRVTAAALHGRLEASGRGTSKAALRAGSTASGGSNRELGFGKKKGGVTLPNKRHYTVLDTSPENTRQWRTSAIPVAFQTLTGWAPRYGGSPASPARLDRLTGGKSAAAPQVRAAHAVPIRSNPSFQNLVCLIDHARHHVRAALVRMDLFQQLHPARSQLFERVRSGQLEQLQRLLFR